MREVEVKAAVPDVGALRSRLVHEGALLVFSGTLEDRRYDTRDGRLVDRDEVLRLRVFTAGDGDAGNGGGTRAALDFKGPTAFENGYKVREEISTDVGDPEQTESLLAALGFDVIREIDRIVELYSFCGAVVRIEIYPRMDPLVEVEGEPSAIERAIDGMGLPREAFTADRLPAFIAAYEKRTGERAAICARELKGDYRFRAADS